jgi:hypothetical protein
MAQEYVLSALIGAVAALATSFGQRVLGRIFDKREKLEALRDSEFETIEKVVLKSKTYRQVTGLAQARTMSKRWSKPR